MNRQKFLAELSKLLGFMSSWDKEAEMDKYTRMLDAAEDEDAFIEALGTPTQIAINIAKEYKPSPRPGGDPPPEPKAEPEPEPQPAAEPEPPPPPPPPKKRDETQVVTDGEFEYGMELAILMGEPISTAVESALEGKYLPDPDFSLEEILREARGEEGVPEPEKPEPPAREPEPVQEELPGMTGNAAEEEAPAKEEPDAAEETGATAVIEAPGPPEEGGGPGTETGPEAEKEGREEPEVGKPAEDGPVFDAGTAPLPEEARPGNSGEGAVSGDADAAGAGETALKLDPSKFAELPPDVPAMPDPSRFAELPPDEPAAPPRRALRPLPTAVFAVFMLLIGLPVALLLILLGVPVLLIGGGTVALVAYAELTMIPALSMFSDILLVGGAGLGICSVGLVMAWFGLWVSIELGSLWLNTVVLPLGDRLCYEKEADGT